MKHLLSAVCAIFLAAPASAVVVGTTFTFEATTTNGTASNTVTAGTEAGFCDPVDGDGCDGGINVFGSAIWVDWIDGDSFDIGFFDRASGFLNISMTGIDFGPGVTISSITPDFVGSPTNPFRIADFLAGPGNPTGAPAPGVITQFSNQTGGGALIIEFSNIFAGLWGDGPTIRFDLGLESTPTGPAPVPLPAGAWLLGSALLAAGLMKRRS